MASVFFMLLKIPRPFLHLFLLSRVYSLHKVETTNKNYWRLNAPTHVCDILKGLEDMSQNSLHKDREAIRTPAVHVRKRLQHYVTNLIDAILSFQFFGKALAIDTIGP